MRARYNTPIFGCLYFIEAIESIVIRICDCRYEIKMAAVMNNFLNFISLSGGSGERCVLSLQRLTPGTAEAVTERFCVNV